VALAILEKQGFRTDVAANGKEVLKALETIPYDLVLMDVQMPEMDGYEATQEIRNPQSHISNHQIPIIAMTANAMQGDRDKCLEAGMNDYVSKPISPESLVTALDKWLPNDNKKTRPESTSKGESDEPAVFDYDGMMKRLMGDSKFAHQITGIFMSDMIKQINKLKQTIHDGDCKTIEFCAHTMKGAAGNIGTDRFRNIAAHIEDAAHSEELTTAAMHIPELEKQFDLAVLEIQKKIPSLPAQ
jgi:CheY-like chemotaxis protein/HPt (histidine-containing phosphotransfer) domain-containing protein